jgi:hypothetical protein
VIVYPRIDERATLRIRPPPDEREARGLRLQYILSYLEDMPISSPTIRGVHAAQAMLAGVRDRVRLGE